MHKATHELKSDHARISRGSSALSARESLATETAPARLLAHPSRIPEVLSPPLLPGMAPVRAHLFRNLQRTYGNRTVMRIVRAANVLRQTAPLQCSDCGVKILRDSRNPIDEEEGLVIEQGETVEAKELPGSTPSITPSVDEQIDRLRGSGQSLPTSVRAFMEPRFGHDFSSVRIHTNAEAARTASSVNARAFTLGRDLVFGTGEYAPTTETGQRLLAHELTHVIQQGQAPRLAQAPQEVQEQEDLSSSSVDRKKIQRVAWTPNTKTGRTSMPWGSGPNGDILKAATDAGTAIDIWSPYDRTTYWCHGYTFGGSTARGGPYSLWGQDVPTVLNDDGWKREYSCVASPGDILVFYTSNGRVAHSGIIRSVSEPGGAVDETASTLESKWGSGSQNTSSWLTNATQYGSYRCFSKSPNAGPCSGNGANELP